jgi:phage-related minor tail protein
MDAVQVSANIIAVLAGAGLSFAMGWWSRGSQERKKRNLQAIESILVAA